MTSYRIFYFISLRFLFWFPLWIFSISILIPFPSRWKTHDHFVNTSTKKNLSICLFSIIFSFSPYRPCGGRKEREEKEEKLKEEEVTWEEIEGEKERGIGRRARKEKRRRGKKLKYMICFKRKSRTRYSFYFHRIKLFLLAHYILIEVVVTGRTFRFFGWIYTLEILLLLLWYFW